MFVSTNSNNNNTTITHIKEEESNQIYILQIIK